MEWIDEYNWCHNGFNRIVFPDGGCLNDQSVLMLFVWNIIESERLDMAKEEENG